MSHGGQQRSIPPAQCLRAVRVGVLARRRRAQERCSGRGFMVLTRVPGGLDAGLPRYAPMPRG
jgi:hypothetical protein